ncbi:MAG TPA: DNA repair exonuclease [Thermodesulfobacteriaceae bacterium]|nr:DNA repair exonuclease [Thermodesulfobacteriaceae bacterium]
MFRFVHAADIHLDSPLRGLSRYESAPKDAIRSACRRAFEKLIDLAIEKEVAFVLLAGDLYDGDWKDYSTGIFLARQMGRLQRHGIQVYAVAGNHDAASRVTRALDLPENMKIFSSRKVETVRPEGLNAAIHGRSFGTRHVDTNLSAGFRPADRGVFNIGMLHTSLDGREGHGVYAPCSLDDLRSRGYQYWALGHVHRQEIVSEDPWVVFPGCIQGRHIREAGPKGCVLVTVENGRVADVEKISLDVLRWELCTVDLTGTDGMEGIIDCTRKAIGRVLESAEGRPVAMRIWYEGTSDAADALAAWPGRLENQVRAVAAEIAPDEVWVERVVNAAVARRDLNALSGSDSALGRLLGEIMAGSDDPDAIDGFHEIVAELRKRIPHDVRGMDSVLDMENSGRMSRIIREARQMLAGRLLAEGGMAE